MIIDKEKIREAKEKLGVQNALIMSELLELKDFDKKNLKACCCFHEEDTPSLIYNPKNYTFHCFGCQKTIDIIDVFMLKGCSYMEAIKQLFDMAEMQYSFGELNVKTKRDYRYPKEVQCENKEKVYEYLGKRKISPETIDYADVRQDERGNIVFNYYDTNDVLTMVKYRPSHKVKKDKGEVKAWCQKDADTSPLLFNMNRINPNAPLLVCEGEIDCLSAIEAGYSNAVSVPLGAGNTHWIDENFDWLEQFSSIIICADNDEAGEKLKKEAVYRLGAWRTKFIEIPKLQLTETKLTKDLNEILYLKGKEAVIDLILNAHESPLDSIVDYSDIQDVDLDEVDGITTGIAPLDRKIMKLFYGTFNIVTGVNGSGKSSFLSQLVCQAMEQNKNVFMYSGELPNHQAKNWIDYIFAGQRNVKQFTNQASGAIYWKVTKEAKLQIHDYYKEKLFIYKDGQANDVEDLLKTMESTIRRYGTKLLIIDNLTSVNLKANENNKWEKQAEFINNLINMAKKFNVVVILVVHPHKIETMRRLNKMDVQGISAIIDLAHRIFSLYRVSENDKKGTPKKNGKGWFKEPIKYDVVCDVLKDRMMGFEGTGASLYYDKPSRRFFVDEKDLDYQYHWDSNTYNTGLPFPPTQFNDDEEIVGTVT